VIELLSFWGCFTLAGFVVMLFGDLNKLRKRLEELERKK
jgi:hypothetical protein